MLKTAKLNFFICVPSELAALISNTFSLCKDIVNYGFLTGYAFAKVLLGTGHVRLKVHLILSTKKEGEDLCVGLLVAQRFLSISINTTPTTAIAMIMPAVAGTKYSSAADAGVGVGAGVASGASSTVK